MAFSEDGSYFVTAGNRSVKFWYFDTSGRDGRVNTAHSQALSARAWEHCMDTIQNCSVRSTSGGGEGKQALKIT